MANVVETSTWEAGVYQFETTDLIQGGPDGVDNLPHKQLGNRTRWLYDNMLWLDGSRQMTGTLQLRPAAGDAINIATPAGVDSVVRITKTGQTAATIKAINGGTLTIGVDAAAGDSEKVRISPTGTFAIGTAFPQTGVGLQVGNGPIQLDVATPGIVTGLVGSGGVTDSFVYDTDKRLAHYGLAWKPFSGQGEAAAALSGYGGIRLFTAGVERMRFTAGGGSATFGAVGSSAITDVQGVIGLQKNSTAGGPWIEFANRGALAQDGSGYEVGGVYGRGYRDVLDPAYIAGISFYRGSSNNGNSSAGTIVFKTDPVGVAKSALITRMIINGSGDVGIGTDIPLAALNVTRGGTVNNNNLFRWTDAINSTGYLTIRNNNGAGVGVGSDGHLAFSTNQQGANVFNECARFGTNGALGIGTINPQAPLHIFSSQDEIIRIQKTNGYVSFYNTANSGRSGYIQGTDGGMILGSDIGPIQLNGSVTHPTPATGAAGTESVTAAWVRAQGYLTSFDSASQFQQSYAPNGYVRMPNGVIIQWGGGTFNAGNVISFPLTFPNACTSVVGCDTAGTQVFGASNKNRFNFTLIASSGTFSMNYIAIGY